MRGSDEGRVEEMVNAAAKHNRPLNGRVKKKQNKKEKRHRSKLIAK